MIKLTNINKKYGERLILKNINLTFPSHGLCIIHGPSGCGKTTLLNCLAGLTSFQGSIEINRQNIASMNDVALSEWRLKSVGFIFQDFKLFETETTWRNLVFPLDTLHALPRHLRDRKCEDVLAVVGLTQKRKQIVNKLSGGEKQRVAIARALINDPYVLLADEPTGALDQDNGIGIMKLIKKIAKKSLVILVSHDFDLAKQFADIIIEMNDGKVTKSLTAESKPERQNLPVIKNKIAKRKIKIPLDFLISHTIHKMRIKKWRTCISYGMTSLGLIGIGLAFSLSTTIGSNIKQAYHELIDENALMVRLKDNALSVDGQYAANFYEVSTIAEEYSVYIEDVGVVYYCNFESFFPDSNALAVVKDLSYRVLPGFSARHINEFTWLEDIKTTLYPQPVKNLADDEIVLGLDILALKNLCFELQIERTVTALTNYLISQELYVYFDIANISWTYSDQQLLKVVAFTLENDITIYHSNHLWNEHMFEERMRFPTSDVISQIDENPWVMKKIYYLKTFDNRDELINLLINDKSADKYIFEIADESYYPWLYYNRAMNDRNRLLVFQNTIAHIPNWQIPYFLASDENLHMPIKGNQGGYLIFPDTLMVGFAKTMYFAKDQVLLEKIIDQQTTRDSSSVFQEELPPSVLSGNYATSLQGGVNYRLIGQQQILGHAPQSNREIVVSSTFREELNINELPATIYVATSKSESLTEEGLLISDYLIVPLTITGIINSNKSIIYQFENWTTLFFQCEVGVSSFSLQNNVLSFPIKDQSKMNESLIAFQKGFPQYEAINPLFDINESVDTVCHYLSVALIIFSSISTLIAIILLTMCNYLYALEGKKEIALARCLGVSKKESRKFLFVNSMIQCLVSFVLASFELVIMSAMANFEISQAFSLSFHFAFNTICLVPMLALALVIALVSNGLISSRINRINPIDALNS